MATLAPGTLSFHKIPRRNGVNKQLIWQMLWFWRYQRRKWNLESATVSYERITTQDSVVEQSHAICRRVTQLLKNYLVHGWVLVHSRPLTIEDQVTLALLALHERYGRCGRPVRMYHEIEVVCLGWGQTESENKCQPHDQTPQSLLSSSTALTAAFLHVLVAVASVA